MEKMDLKQRILKDLEDGLSLSQLKRKYVSFRYVYLIAQQCGYKLTNEQRELKKTAIIQDLDDGLLTAQEIAAKNKCSLQWLCHVSKVHGKSPRSQYEKRNEIIAQDILNMTNAEILQKHGITLSTLNVIKKKINFKRMKHVRSQEHKALRARTIEEDLKDGMSENDICRKYDLSIRVLRDIRKEFNI